MLVRKRKQIRLRQICKDKKITL
jgi:hypothetical protein